MSVASEKPCGASDAMPVVVERERRDHAREGRQQDRELVDLVEDRLLVLLQVAVVREREALERGEQAGQVADETPGLAARELGDVRVLLLRHDARPRGVGVVQAHEAELLGRPEDDLLGEPREVDGEHRGDEGELGDDVARGGAVDRVLDRTVEPQLGGDGRRVQPERRAGERAGAVRREGGARVPVDPALDVAQQRPGVREQVVRRAAPAARAAGGCGPASARRRRPWPARRARRRRRARGRRARAPRRRRYIRTSVAIWSLRDRPARSLPPRSAPARSISPRSSAVCTSSSSSTGRKSPAATSARSRSSASTMPSSSSSDSSPAACRTRACATEPEMSSVREPPVEVRRLRQRLQRRPTGRRRTGRPTARRCRRAARAAGRRAQLVSHRCRPACRGPRRCRSARRARRPAWRTGRRSR